MDYAADITISIDKTIKIADVTSPSHAIKVENRAVTAKGVKLDKDYILYIKMANEAMSGGYYSRMPDGGVYAFLQFMPALPEPKTHIPQRFVFVVDCSGSMSGVKMEKTKAALIKCLGQLQSGDEFTVIRFGSSFSVMPKDAAAAAQPRVMPNYSWANAFGARNGDSLNASRNAAENAQLSAATAENLKTGAAYIRSLGADDGGTEIWPPIKFALDNFGGQKTVVLLTDGQVGNERGITEDIKRHIGQSRLFIFGIDSAVNDAGLTAFAKAGRGRAEFFTPDERLDQKIIRQFARINGAVCASVRLDGLGNAVEDKIELSDTVFNREYWCAVLKLKALTDGFALLCDLNGKEYRAELPLSELRAALLALDKIYAKEKIRRLEDYIANNRYGDGAEGYIEQIVETAVRYNVDSEYTSFLTVNERENKLFDVPEQEQIVLEAPASWEGGRMYYEPIFKKSCKDFDDGSAALPSPATSSNKNRQRPPLYQKSLPHPDAPCRMSGTPIKYIGLSAGVYNLLNKAGIRTVEELTKLTVDDLRKAGLERKSLDEVIRKLQELGLDLKGRAEKRVQTDSRVTLLYDGGKRKTVVIRKAGYAIPAARAGKDIAETSALAQSLLGKREGDGFEHAENGASYKGQIVKITAAAPPIKDKR